MFLWLVRDFIKETEWNSFAEITDVLGHLCFSSRALRTLARSSALIWSEMIICSTTWWAIPGRVFWSRSNSTAPVDICGPQCSGSHQRSVHPSRSKTALPCEMVFRSSSKLRKDREATWGLPQRSVSSSTSSSNLIHRAVSFHCSSWFLSIVSSFSSTNTWKWHQETIKSVHGQRRGVKLTLTTHEHSTCVPKNWIHNKSFPCHWPKFKCHHFKTLK